MNILKKGKKDSPIITHLFDQLELFERIISNLLKVLKEIFEYSNK